MDVRCERCKTEYELDETRIAEAGLTVKCTQCGNIFKVRKPFITTPGLEVPPQKEWRVRRQDGQQLALRNLTELQRWIVERRVGPDDEVSLSGETWRKLGTLPELGAFFEVVQVAEQGRALGAPPVSRDVALSDTMVGIPMEDSAAQMARSRTPAWSGQAVATGRGAPEPAWAMGSTPSVEVDLDEHLSPEELKNLRGGGAGKWLVLLLVVAGGGGGAYWLIKSQPSSPPGTLPAPKMEPPPSLQPSMPSPPESAKPAEPVEPQPEAKAAAAHEAAPADVAPPRPTAVPPSAVPPSSGASPPVPAATAPQPAMANKEGGEGGGIPAGKGINFYLAQGHHLLDSKPELALKYFAKAGETDPHSPEPDSGRGLAYSNMERWGDAVAAFQLSLKKSPEYTEAIMGLAEAYRAQGSAGNKRKALGLYRRYLDLAPDGPDAPVAKAQVEILEGDLKAEAAPANATPTAPAEAERPGAPSPPAAAPAPVAAPPPNEPLNPPPPVLATPPKPPGP